MSNKITESFSQISNLVKEQAYFGLLSNFPFYSFFLRVSKLPFLVWYNFQFSFSRCLCSILDQLSGIILHRLMSELSLLCVLAVNLMFFYEIFLIALCGCLHKAIKKFHKNIQKTLNYPLTRKLNSIHSKSSAYIPLCCYANVSFSFHICLW